MKRVIPEIIGFRKFTGEPNRMEDLRAFGLVRAGDHTDVKTANVTIGGQEREVRVSASTFMGETVLIPVKADFRKAVREAGDMSLRPLRVRY